MRNEYDYQNDKIGICIVPTAEVPEAFGNITKCVLVYWLGDDGSNVEMEIQNNSKDYIHDLNEAMAYVEVLITRLEMDEVGGAKKNQNYINLGNKAVKTLREHIELLKTLLKQCITLKNK